MRILAGIIIGVTATAIIWRYWSSVVIWAFSRGDQP